VSHKATASQQSHNPGHLTATDIANLQRSYITPDLAARAGVYRVDTAEGAALVGRKMQAGTEYAGLVFPYVRPGETTPHLHRLRRDKPDLVSGKNGQLEEKGKYLSPPGLHGRPSFYFPPDTPLEWLSDPTIPVVFTEGEKKALALWRYFQERGEKVLVIGLSGVWNWRCKVEHVPDEKTPGKKRAVKGPLPDFDRVVWKRRAVYIVFDTNVYTNEKVEAARRGLMRELQQRGAVIECVDLPEDQQGVNGIDDLLAAQGPRYVAGLFASAERRIRQALNAPEGDGQAQTKRTSQADDLTELAQRVELFYCPEEDASFASFAVKNHRETHKLNSKAFRHYLAHLYHHQTGKVPNAEALQSTLSCLEGKARFDGEQYQTFLRLAPHNGCFYWDLCNADWEVVEISATGWRVIPAAQAPVRFRRTRGMQALPTPVSGGDLDALKRFVNYPNASAWVLHTAWLVAALRADGRNFPVLIFNGEQGSAKSTASRITRSLIDPNVADLRPKPREDLDLFLAARNGWVCGFDNLSGLQRDFSDSLCRLATGTGFGKRELYSDEGEVLFQVARPVLLNGIDDLAEKADLVDRSIFIELPPIPDEERQDEETLWQEFDAAKPALLGALADAASKALRDLPTVKLDRLPRMADFAKWGVAAGVGGEGVFLATYYDNREKANESAIQANEFAGHVLDWFGKKEDHTLTLTGLLAELSQAYKEAIARQRDCPADKVKLPKYWPANEKKLSNELRRIAPILRKSGLEIADAGLDNTTRKAQRRFYKVINQSGKVSHPSQASYPSAASRSNDGASGYSPKDRPKDATAAPFASFGNEASRRIENGAPGYPSGYPSEDKILIGNALTDTPKDAKGTKDAKLAHSGSAHRKVVKI
jgi:hypothetical protein